MALRVGDLVGGRYALEHLIGSGGMGDVFRAKDRVLARAVAVKLVYAGDPRKQAEVAKSFLREARISAAVSHPNVVQILDFGIHENTIPFMVLELLEGEPLAAVLSRGDAMTFDWILHVTLQVARGLSAAHEAGVVHRDLKPENIYLVRGRDDVQAKILDFGISRIVETDPNARSGTITTTGKVLGTPAYMSPEQARGQSNVDKRSDVYALGVVLYELISGSLPFYADNAFDLLTKIVNEEAIPLYRVVPDVEPALAEVVARAMNKQQSERFADASEIASALSRVAETLSGSSSARKLGTHVRPLSWRRHGSTQHSEANLRALPSDLLDDATKDAKTDVFAAVRGKKQRGRGLRVVTATAIFAALSGMAIANSLLGGSSAESQHFIVVRADDRKPVEEPKAAAPAKVLDEPAKEPAKAPVELAAAAEKPRAEASIQSPAQLLTASFRKQKGGIVQCVNAHAELASSTPELGVRLELDAQGKVLSARAAPDAVALSDLGRCIAGAAQTMKFPAPGAAIALQVPLTTKRGGPK